MWKRKAPALLEFPPVMSNGALFQLADNGQLKSLRKSNGKTLWKKKLGRLAASSPALDSKRVYATLLVGGSSGRGRIVALRQRNGKRHWSRTLPSRSESSPLVTGGRIYFGSENGTLYCLERRTGKVKWTYRAAGAIKGSPTLAHGKLFFGDYGGRVQAVRAKNGHRVWSSAGPAVSTRRRRWPAGACSSARPRARVRVLDQERRACAGRTRPGATSTPRRRSAASRGGGGPCSSAPTTGASTRSTRQRARALDLHVRAARSPARPR